MGDKYPITRRENIVEEIHGVKIEDPYRWLEDSSSSEVKEWFEEQNKLSSSIIDQYLGGEIVKKRMHDLFLYDYIEPALFQIVTTPDGPRFFYFFRAAGKSQPSLCYQDGEQGQRIVLFDPLGESKDALVSIDWFKASSDGCLVAYGISEGGTEQSVLYVMDVQKREILTEKIPQTKWCELVWLKNIGFYYSRYPLSGTVSPEDENYYHHVYYHKLGDDYTKDVKVFGDGRLKTEHPLLSINENCTHLAVCSYRFISSDIHVAHINSEEPNSLDFIPVIETESTTSIPSMYGDQLFIITQIDAPNGQILQYDLSIFSDDRKVPDGKIVVKETEGVIFGSTYYRFVVFNGRIAVIEDKNASSSLKIYDIESGKLVEDVGFDSHVTIYQLVGAAGSDTFYYSLGSFFYPDSHNSYKNGESHLLYKPNLDIDSSLFQSKLVWYKSKDGTKVSMFILSRRGMEMSEETPVTLTGYGGFGIPLTPAFSQHHVTWIEQGGVIAIANLRGGGEYGQKWHRAGNRENKQHVFDDFIAAAEWLADNEIGSPATIAIHGGSNGGLLVGAALVQRPDLFGAVTCHVPLLDMIRYTNFQVAKTWSPEYGDPEIKEEFEWLYSYSPYHHVKNEKYPPTLLLTALGDTRVDTMHAFKMAAKLQNTANEFVEERPLLLHTESQAGHGVGSPVEKTVEILKKSFIFRAQHTGLNVE
ncbi:S9 family peptidase [Candidatus Thorarchaeota archaeon]|nr:MAG: S9 family peptidase [Candidatus Thorarchaeota archaeon]